MTVMLVKNTFYDIPETEVLFYKTSSGVETGVTITGGFLGNLKDLLDAIELEYNIVFSGLMDKEFVTATLPANIDSIDWKDLELGKWLGFKGTETIGSRWGLSRFLIDDVFIGHEASSIRPYDIESQFTLDGRVYKDTPKIANLFYQATFGDYLKEQVETGVIPFVENLESDTDMLLSQDGFNYFQGFFNSTLLQLNFDKKYLEPGDRLNSSSVKVQISERPSDENGAVLKAFLTLSDGTYIVLTDGSYVVVER